MKVALVSDWLVTFAGAEKVEEAILELFPEADIFTCIYNPKSFENTAFEKHKIFQSFISKMPFAKKSYQKYLPLMTYAVEQFDLSSYDLIISSSHAVAKGVITGPDQLHVCYCHSPIRYAWDLQHQYLKESRLNKGLKGLLAKFILHKMRLWDVRTANGVDFFIANSNYISRRINKVYRRDSKVIYPNVAVDEFELYNKKEEFYLTASRLVPYKKIALIADAFSKMPDKKLVIIGAGEQEKYIKEIKSNNIIFLGYQPFAVLKDYMQRAKAFVFAAEEDFGIIPIEAQACGTPVIAYGRGGVCETVINEKTGILFEKQTITDIIKAVNKFEKKGVSFSPEEIRDHAKYFSKDRFKKEFLEYISYCFKK